MKAKAIAGEGEKGALFRVFLDPCCGHKGLCTTFLLRGGKSSLSTPSVLTNICLELGT